MYKELRDFYNGHFSKTFINKLKILRVRLQNLWMFTFYPWVSVIYIQLHCLFTYNPMFLFVLPHLFFNYRTLYTKSLSHLYRLYTNAFTAESKQYKLFYMHRFAQFALRRNGWKLNKTNECRSLPVWCEWGMGQVAGVIIGSCGGCSGRVQAHGQRGHTEGILSRGIGPETTEILFWYSTGGHCISQLSGETEDKTRIEAQQRKTIISCCFSLIWMFSLYKKLYIGFSTPVSTKQMVVVAAYSSTFDFTNEL